MPHICEICGNNDENVKRNNYIIINKGIVNYSYCDECSKFIQKTYNLTQRIIDSYTYSWAHLRPDVESILTVIETKLAEHHRNNIRRGMRELQEEKLKLKEYRAKKENEKI